MTAPHPVVLVTGVGDTVGQGLVKAARQSTVPLRVVGTDSDRRAAGLDWVDRPALLPHCAQPEAYVAALLDVCRQEGVGVVLPGSEPELLVLAEHAAEISAGSGAVVVAGRPAGLRTALDKWETCRFLEAHGLRFPRYARAERAEELARLVDEVGFPLLAKPRRGSGSRGVAVLRTPEDLEAVRGDGTATVVQELLGAPEEEYSVETWTALDGRALGPISYRREQLSAGDTYSARVAAHPEVEQEGLAVAEALGSAGPCNVQLRMTDRGPVTFEINPRFSGGVSMRAHFGFNEVELAVREHVLGERPEAPRLRSGHVRRFWSELYRDDPAGSEAPAPVGLPRPGAAPEPVAGSR